MYWRVILTWITDYPNGIIWPYLWRSSGIENILKTIRTFISSDPLILTDYKTCSVSQLFSCYLSLRTSGSSSCAEPSPILLDRWWEETWIAKVGHKESIQKKVAFISLLHIVEWVFITFSCDTWAALNIGGQTFTPIVHLITLLREAFSLRSKMHISVLCFLFRGLIKIIYFRWNIF